MDENELATHIEAGRCPPEGFTHHQHVMLAWWYLQRHSFDAALDRFRSTLQRFAAAQGKPGLYHETITTAYLLLIDERRSAAATDLSWDAFAEQNPDVMGRHPSILDRYYTSETLASDRARRMFVLPDRTPITGARQQADSASAARAAQ
jgi:hypothetical protein